MSTSIFYRQSTASSCRADTRLLLTIHDDLCLANLRRVGAGDVAAIRASVVDIDLVDSQDASNFRGMSQSLTVGLSIHPAVCLVTRKKSESHISKHLVVFLSTALRVCTSLPGYDHWISNPVSNSTIAVQFIVRVSPAISSTGSTGNSLTS